MNLPVGGSVTFTVTATVERRRRPAPRSNTATVAVPGGRDGSDPGQQLGHGHRHRRSRRTTRPPAPSTCSSAPPRRDMLGPAPNDQNWFRFGVARRPVVLRRGRQRQGRHLRSAITILERLPRRRHHPHRLRTTTSPTSRVAGGSRACATSRPRREDNLARVTAGAERHAGRHPRAGGGDDAVLPVVRAVVLGQRIRDVHPDQEHHGHRAQRDGDAHRCGRGHGRLSADGDGARERELQPAGVGAATGGLRPERRERRVVDRARRSSRAA